MDDKLEKKWITNEVSNYCNHIGKQLEKSYIQQDKYEYVDSVRRRVDLGFCFSDEESLPKSYIIGERCGTSWEAKACQCTTVIRNEQ